MGDADYEFQQALTVESVPSKATALDRQIIEASPHIFLAVDRKGHILRSNPAFRRLVREVSHATELHALIRRPQADALDALIRRVFQGEVVASLELVMVGATGDEHIFQASAYPIFEEGGVRACVFSGIDVTPQAVRQRELEQLEAFFAQVLYHIPFTLSVMDPEGRCLYLNPAAVRDDRQRNWAIGRDVVAYFEHLGLDASAARRRLEMLRLAVRERRVVSFDEHVVGLNGEELYFHRIMAPVIDENGTVDFVIEAGRDITDREKIRQALMSMRHQLASYLKQAPFAIIRWNPDFTVKAWNATAENIFGFTEKEVIGRNPAEFMLPPSRKDEVYGIFQQLNNGRGGTHNVNENLTKSGEVIVCSWYNTPLRDDEGKLVEVVSVAHDITGRARRSEMRAQSEERFRLLVQNASDTITVIDENGLIRFVSPSVYRVFGYDPEKLLEKSVLDFIHPDDMEAAQAAFRQTLNDPKATPFFELRLAHARGHWVHTETVTSNLLDDPRVRGVVMNTRDITERKAFERRLIAAKEEAETMAQIKNTIVNNISHEVRTPLTAILGFAEILVEEVPDDQREFAQLVYTSGKRLMQTLNSVLDFSRLESGELTLKIEEVDILPIIDETLTLFHSQAEQKRIAVSVDIPARPVLLSVDPNALSRIMSNLVSNAVKFTPSGGEISIAVVEEEMQVVIRVSDNGIGMSEAFLPQLFQAFKQESEGLSRQHRGSGLGLAITRRLIEAMRGTISVTSRQGVGTTFTVMLPQWEDLT